MVWSLIPVALAMAVAALSKLVLGLVALQGAPPGERARIIRAVGDAWRVYSPAKPPDDEVVACCCKPDPQAGHHEGADHDVRAFL